MDSALNTPTAELSVQHSPTAEPADQSIDATEPTFKSLPDREPQSEMEEGYQADVEPADADIHYQEDYHRATDGRAEGASLPPSDNPAPSEGHEVNADDPDPDPVREPEAETNAELSAAPYAFMPIISLTSLSILSPDRAHIDTVEGPQQHMFDGPTQTDEDIHHEDAQS